MRKHYLVQTLFLAALTFSGRATAQDITRDVAAFGFANGNVSVDKGAFFLDSEIKSTASGSGGRSIMDWLYRVDGKAAARDFMTEQTDTARDYNVSGTSGAMVDGWLVVGINGKITKDAGGKTTFSHRARIIPKMGGVFNPANAIADDNPAAFTAAGAISRFTITSLGAIAAKQYRVLQETSLEVDTAAAQAGKQNIIDLQAGGRGMFAALVTTPRGLGNSRNAIGVDKARADKALTKSGSNLDGTGVKIGVLELNRAIGTHLDLPTGGGTPALTIDPQSSATKWRSEHTTAVAGIIGSRSATAAQAGIAKDARLFSSALDSYGGTGFEKILKSMDWLVDQQKVNVFNASFGVPNGPKDVVDEGDSQIARFYDWVADTKRVIGVVSAGNSGSFNSPKAGLGGRGNPAVQSLPDTIGGNNGGFNTIVVGALDYDFKARAFYSSFGVTSSPADQPRIKPDVVAPGTWILSPLAVDLDGDGKLNDYGRAFFGAFDLTKPTTLAGSPIHGTSFAAPHVTGAVGMMLDFAKKVDGNLTSDRSRPQVVKSLLMNTADRTVKHRNNTPWAQGLGGGNTINKPIDEELGAGMVRVDRALRGMIPQEGRAGDAASATSKTTVIRVPEKTWDWQEIKKKGDKGQRVSYQFKKGLVKGEKIRTTTTWNRKINSKDGDNDIEASDTFTGTNLTNLKMELWGKLNEKASWGKDPVLTSDSPHDNVELFNESKLTFNGIWAIDIVNQSAQDDNFAVALEINSNPAAAGGRLAAFDTSAPQSLGFNEVSNDLLPIEETSGVFMKPTFLLDDLADDSDEVFILDDNLDFEYLTGESYQIFWGPELRLDPNDTTSDVNWFDDPLLPTLDELLLGNNWLELTSGLVDADENLTPMSIADPSFWAGIAASTSPSDILEYNFVIDVDGDRAFTADIDGIGWFQVLGSAVLIPEPSTLLLAAIGSLGLVISQLRTGRKRSSASL